MINQVFAGLDRTLTQFHAWALADLTSSTTKGMIAEYLVRCALGVDAEPAPEWDYVDIRTPSGFIEVKSASVLSSGPNRKVIQPAFGIERSKMAWSTLDSCWIETDPTRRRADIYVFCLHGETDPGRADALDISQWHFWAIPSVVIDRKCGLIQKTIRVSGIRSMRDEVAFPGLAGAIAATFAEGCVVAD